MSLTNVSSLINRELLSHVKTYHHDGDQDVEGALAALMGVGPEQVKDYLESVTVNLANLAHLEECCRTATIKTFASELRRLL